MEKEKNMDNNILSNLPKDLTFDKVLEVFGDYLSKDDKYEIVNTSHGYTLMEWDFAINDWAGSEFCATPQNMVAALLDALANYLENSYTHGERDISEGEYKQLKSLQEEYLKKLL